MVTTLPMSIEYVGEVLNGAPMSADSFLSRLLHLLPSADPGNRANLRAGFPRMVAAWEAWMESPDGTGWEQPFYGRGFV